MISRQVIVAALIEHRRYKMVIGSTQITQTTNVWFSQGVKSGQLHFRRSRRSILRLRFRIIPRYLLVDWRLT